MPTTTKTSPQVRVERLDPWKEDGNIVLAAEEKHFRVHRSVLSAYSEVFKDMFDCFDPHSNACDSEPFIEGCPVVDLQDTAIDLRVVLKAMYDRIYPARNVDEKTPFSVVSAFLRLGEKYMITALTAEAKGKLCCYGGPMFMTKAASLAAPPFLTANLFPMITSRDPHDFQLMNLLQEMNIKAPLPVLLYRCIVTCPLEMVLDGYQFDDSSYTLSAANLRSSLLMKNEIGTYQTRLTTVTKSPVSCAGWLCERNMCRLWLGNMDEPFGRWRPEWDDFFCGKCLPDFKRKREVEMIQAWGRMPAVFGLDSWRDVENGI